MTRALFDRPVPVAIVGCGYVADFYLQTAALHPELAIIGCHDIDKERCDRLASRYGLIGYGSLEELLCDSRIEIVVNLTSTASHFDVSRQCLISGRHVYTEKPIALTLSEAEELCSVAFEKGCSLSCAPCVFYSAAIQSLKLALEREAIGTPRLVYAEMEDGPIFQMDYASWLSTSGCPWPYREEFERGCVVEHVGYCLGWMVPIFGRVESVHPFAASMENPSGGTDFSVVTLCFESGVIGRLTVSTVSPANRQVKVIGSGGALTLEDCWDYASRVKLQAYERINVGGDRFHLELVGRGYLPAGGEWAPPYEDVHAMDFCAGIGALATSVRRGEKPLLSGELGLHILDVTLQIEAARRAGALSGIQ
jgi:predicted dehydrogenase